MKMNPSLSLLFSALLVGAFPVYAADVLWTNAAGNQDFTKVENWNGGVGPGATDYALINSVGGDAPMFSGTYPNIYGIRVGIDAEGYVEFADGTFAATTNSNQISRIGMGTGNGRVFQSGGDVSINAMQLGVGADAVGRYELTGGHLRIARGQLGASLFVGSGGRGEFEISGGSFDTRTVVSLGANGGTGVFSVVGSGPTLIGIGSHSSVDGGWLQSGTSTLKLAVDDGGLTKIFVDDYEDATAGGNVTFSEGALIDVDFIGTGELEAGRWVAMEWEGVLTDAGLTLAAEDAAQGWGFVFEDRGVNGDVGGVDSLVLTYQPPVEGHDLVLGRGESLSVEVTLGASGSVKVDGEDGLLSLPGNAIFAEGSTVDISIVGEPLEGRWSILEWEGTLFDNGLALEDSLVEAGWDIAFEDNGVSDGGVDTLVLSYSMREELSTDKRFQHPGLMHTKSDLDRAKFNIQAGVEPWASQFADLAADSFSSYDYTVRGDRSITYLNRENPAVNRYQFEQDFTAAYQNALMWYFTGDQRHADKAIEVFNAWSSLRHVDGIPLGAGIYGWGMLQSAEIIRYSNAGWKEEDIKKFEAMLVYPGYSNTKVPAALNGGEVSFYWKTYVGDSGRAGNQDMSCYMTQMAIGIFLDDERIYDRGLRYLKGMPHRRDDLPYPSGPHRTTTVAYETEYQIGYGYENLGTVEDYGFDGVLTHYIFDNGQCQETDRDQSHSILGMGFLSRASQLAWNQGDDLYGFTDSRLLLGWEYHLKYNISYFRSYPDQVEPWEPRVETGEFYQRLSRSGRVLGLKPNPWVGTNLERQSRGEGAFSGRAYLEMPLNHYKYCTHLDPERYKWMERGLELDYELTGNYETRSTNNMAIPSYGAAMFRRSEWMAGEPVSGFEEDFPIFEIPFIPGVVEAENFDYYQQDAGGGEGLTYHDSDDVNSGGEYRSFDGVDIEMCSEGGYCVTDMAEGEWMTYTVHVPVGGEYAIAVRYAADSGGGAIRIGFNGSDVKSDVSLPSTGSGSSWSTHVIAEGISLEKGVQTMRIYVGGTSDVLAINYVEIGLMEVASSRREAEVFDGGRGVEVVASSDIDGGSHLTSIEEGEFTLYNSVYFGEKSLLRVRVARPEGTPDCRIEIRETYGLGDSLVVVEIPTTGGWDEWVTLEEEVYIDPGNYRLFFVYRQDTDAVNEPLFNFDWFEVLAFNRPADVRVESLTTRSAELEWEPTRGATGYSIKRSFSPEGPYELVETVSSSTTKYIDGDVVTGSVYYYVVSSVHGDVEGDDTVALVVAPSGILSDDETVIELVPSEEGDALIFEVSNTALGHRYVVQKAEDISSPEWVNASEAVWGSGRPKQIEVALDPESPGMFYRLKVYRF